MKNEHLVDPELRERVKTIDAAVLGQRIRRARQRAGLTQSHVAGDDMSTAYISRIEAGQRRPAVTLLVRLADRLGCSPADLVAPSDTTVIVDADLVARLTLALDYAELALRTGSAEEALAGADAVLRETQSAAVPVELRRQARYVRALALESSGDGDGAIIALEDAVDDDIDGVRLIQSLMALSRCYRESGDLHRAVDVGERAVRLVDAAALTGSAEGIQLALTVAAAHYERGDVNHAVRLCTRAIEHAEQLDSPLARASAYWNSSLMQSLGGHVDAALPLAQKAIALLEQTSDARNVARLRTELGILQLRLDPPQADAAIHNLTRAQTELAWTSAQPMDLVATQLGLARAQFVLGAGALATSLAEECLESARDVAPLVATQALVLLGQVATAQGDVAAATARFHDAIAVLTGVGADRGVAQLWFELAALLEERGAMAEALDAYRRAAASTGLTPTRTRLPQRQV